MHADFELGPNGEVNRPKAPGWGGARRGSGPKPAGYVRPEEVADFDKAKARNELAKAQLNELDLKIKSGEYVSRAAVRQASATTMAMLVQSMRSLSDNLERRGVPANVCALVDIEVQAALTDVGRDLEMFGGSDD